MAIAFSSNSVPNIFRVLPHDDDFPAEGQVVADKDRSAYRETDGHGAVIGIPEGDRKPDFGSFPLELQDREELVALSGKPVIFPDQGIVAEDVLADHQEFLSQMVMGNRHIAFCRFR